MNQETIVSSNRNQVPFSHTITVTVREGVHNRQVQKWAPYEFEGKQYKLILQSRRQAIEAGEVWEVYPEHSPNGHIIFCQASRRLKTASGEHSFIARTVEHVRNHWMVEVTPKFRTDWMWKRGPLQSVSIEGETLSITLLDHLSQKSFRFSCSVHHTESWVNRRNPESQRFGGDCEVAGKRYWVLFTADPEL